MRNSRFKSFKFEFSDDRGSISVLTIGLFSVLLFTALILTDISTVYLAKRTLTLASEAAVQRGMKNLDQEAYYSGEFNLSQMALTALGMGESDPGIPIDCDSGIRDAREQLVNWQGRDNSLSRRGLSAIDLIEYQCDGFQIFIRSRANVRIPFPIPFIDIRDVSIEGVAGALGERADTNNYYGFDLG